MGQYRNIGSFHHFLLLHKVVQKNITFIIVVVVVILIIINGSLCKRNSTVYYILQLYLNVSLVIIIMMHEKICKRSLIAINTFFCLIIISSILQEKRNMCTPQKHQVPHVTHLHHDADNNPFFYRLFLHITLGLACRFFLFLSSGTTSKNSNIMCRNM